MSGKKGNITHSLQNKIQQLESFRDAGEIVIKSWDLCVKQKLAAPLRNSLMQRANTEGDWVELFECTAVLGGRVCSATWFTYIPQ